MKLAIKSKSLWSIEQISRHLFTLIILGLAVHLLIPQFVTLEHSMQVLQQMVLWAIILAIIAQISSYLGSGYLLKSIVQLSDHKLSTGRATIIVLAAASLGMVAGGMVGIAAATYRWVQKAGATQETAGLAGIIPGFFNASVLVLVSLVGLIHLLFVHQLTKLQAVSFVFIFLLLGGIAGLLIWGFRHRVVMARFIHQLSNRWSDIRKKKYSPEKIDNWLSGLFNSWDVLIKGGWQGPAFGAILNLVFDMLTLYFLFIAAGHPVSPGVLLTGYGIPLLIGRLAFFIPGGIGVVESTMVALYDNLGVPDPISVVVVLAYRILSFWLPFLLGFPMIFFLQRSLNSSNNNVASSGS